METLSFALDESQQAAVDAVLSEDAPSVLILTGKAGTGKSTVIAELEQRTDLIKAATTGRAALNIGGMTIDSLFSYDRDRDCTRNMRFLGENMRACPDLICLDEFSMGGTRMSNYICNVAEYYAKRLLLIGDWGQAAPVKDDWGMRSRLLQQGVANGILRLTTVHRQHQENYLAALDCIRHGFAPAAHHALFQQRVVRGAPDDVIRLFATNTTTDNYNTQRLYAVSTQLRASIWRPLTAVVEDMRDPATARRFPLSDKMKDDWAKNSAFAHGDEGLFCIGARAVITQNQPLSTNEMTAVERLEAYRNREYVNGDVGTILNVDPSYHTSRQAFPSFIDILIDRTGRQVRLGPHYQENPEANGSISKRVIGIPIRLGWAITIHKAQGMTVDQAYVDMDSIRPQWHGLAYVALSRTRTLEGLWLSNWRPDLIYCDPEVRPLL